MDEGEGKKARTKVFATEEELNAYVDGKIKKSRKPFDWRKFLRELHQKR